MKLLIYQIMLMIDNKENNNKNNKKLEKEAKKNYKSIYSKHNKLDINYDRNFNKSLDDKTKNQKYMFNICCKEFVFLILNIISFVLFYLSFTKKSDNDIIYYYFIYPIHKNSLIFLLINASITSLIIILVKINHISMFHLFYCFIFYIWIYFKYHLVNKNISFINYFDFGNCHFYIFFIILIHTLRIMLILYNIAYYFYLSGQLTKTENSVYGILVDYWESEKKIVRLENYMNINLDQLITSKGYSHEENIINKKKNSKVIWRIIFIGFVLVLIHVLLMIKKIKVFNCDFFNKGLISHNIDVKH